jgi:Flp pilus assembly protein TadG
MLHVPSRQRARRGTAIVEFAVLLPLIVALLFGIWEVGRLIEIQQLLSNAAREGGRQASIGQLSNAEVRQVVVTYLQKAGLSTGNVVVNVADVTSPGTDVTDAQQLDQLSVTVSIPVSDVRWLALDFFVAPGARLNAQAMWYCVRDKDYPSPSDPAIE